MTTTATASGLLQRAGAQPLEPATDASLVGLLLKRLGDSPKRRALASSGPTTAALREWTWGELTAAAVDLATHLEAQGLQRGDRLAHLGPHGVDWIVVDLACLLSGIEHAALHHDAPHAEQFRQLDWLAPQAIAFSGTGPGLPSGRLPSGLRVLDMRQNQGLAEPRLAGARWQAWLSDIPGLTAEMQRRLEACDPGACATVVISSGTTGRPHGVRHCQRALALNAAAASEVFLDEPADVRLSWLPLSHALARTGDLYTALVRGGCLHVVSERSRILQACQQLPPTVILGVPAFFERLERGVKSGTIPDLAAALGGRVRVCVSGGAPLRERTVAVFAAAGVPLVQGYGLAEAGPVVTLASPRNARAGTAGPPLAGVDVRVDAGGQLLVRTPSRALGTIGPAEQGSDSHAPTTPQPEPSDWLETGDLATIDADGQVRITGRIGDTLVLAGGIKVPPAEVERVLVEDPACAQVCVCGTGLAGPVALVVPEPAVLRAAIKRMGVKVFSRRQALSHPRVLAWITRRLARRQQHLPRSWRVRKIVLVGRALDEAHGETTPSLKLKRQAIAHNFSAAIHATQTMPNTPPVPRSHPAEKAHWIGATLWGPAGNSFAEAAAQAALPQRDAVAGLLEASRRAIEQLRAEGRLYDPPTHPVELPRAPLADAPARPQGIFSRAAEEALGAAGLWGLAVPEAFGGSGCTLLELAQAIAQVAADAPTAAGMLAVHSSIGAVSALAAFGTPDQQARHLPGLARGRPLSIFGATEPEAGCDLHAVRSAFTRANGQILLTGTKMFITGATHGRLAKVLATLDGRPAVAVVQLPDSDTPTFKLARYALHPLKHAHNNALVFENFVIDAADLLPPPGGPSGDSMPIVWHGLNRGRVTLTAQAAGTLRILKRQARDHAQARSTWGQPIASRQLIQGRLARIAASTVACDSLLAWAAAAVDVTPNWQGGELEAMTAKIIASQCVRDAAIDALGVHGGRAFLVGHPLGDSLHDHFAVTVYEGESDLLGLALFKGLCKLHPSAAKRADPAPLRRAAAWLAWRVGRFAAASGRADSSILDARLRAHARQARRGLAACSLEIDRALRRHGRELAERQLEVGALSAAVRDFVSVLAVAHHTDTSGAEESLPAADCWCRLALARALGRRLSPADHAAFGALGKSIAMG